MMLTFKRFFFSCVCAAVLLGLFSWPLFRSFNEGIPHTSLTPDRPAVRYMVMGDHLQLLYHYWLAADWLIGETPVGLNPYLFNTGDDAETACPVMDYLPYSGVFALFFLLFSRAASWNLTMLFSISMGVFFCWRLVRIYEKREWLAFTLAALSTALPYQWATLFGGSPTGFAMMTVPMLLYGMEKAIRSASIPGGFLAALALLSAFWTDTHILLFSLMLGPAWAVLVVLHDESFPWRKTREWARRIGALLPLGLAALYTMFIRMGTQADLGDTIVGAGRTWREVSLFSPTWRGLMHRGTTGHDHTIYLGVLCVVLLLTSVAVSAWEDYRARRWRRCAHGLILAGAFAVMIAFALGPHGPGNAYVFKKARDWIPPIEMLRQPGKIFAMFAPILALLALPLWRTVSDRFKRPTLRVGVPVALAVLVLLDWKSQIRAGISLLTTEQGAYAAVAADAEEPRAVVVPLWAGDSAWASLYQHTTSLYRLRLLNGYLPVVARDYIDHTYSPLRSINHGGLTPEMIERLHGMGITYLIFHQNAFPEQVSWMPGGATLKRFLTHPQLALMAQDGPVWAFRILSEPDETRPQRRVAVEATRHWAIFGARIQSEIEHEHRAEGALILEDAHAGDGRYVRLTEPGEHVTMGGFVHQEAEDAHVMLRARGTAHWQYVVDNEAYTFVDEQYINTEAWTWISLPTPWRPDTERIRPAFRLVEGQLDLDRMAYVSGRPPALAPGESYLIPAPTFYHAGYTDLAQDAVVLRRRYEPDGRILYGPRWPLPDGTYTAEIVWAEPPPPDTQVGHLEIRLGLHHDAGSIPLTGHHDEPLIFSTRPINLPLEFGFHYSRRADVKIRGIRVTRTE